MNVLSDSVAAFNLIDHFGGELPDTFTLECEEFLQMQDIHLPEQQQRIYDHALMMNSDGASE